MPISDIRPSTNIESEIFPSHKPGQNDKDDLFTPPTNLKAAEDEFAINDENFFITEDVRNEFIPKDPIKEEGSDEE